MSRQRVSISKVERLIGELEGATTNIRTRLDELDAKVRELRGAWNGEAANAYERAQAAWTVDLAVMNGMLARARDAAASSNQRYRDTQAKVDARWG